MTLSWSSSVWLNHGVLLVVSRENAQQVVGVVTFDRVSQFLRNRRASGGGAAVP